MQAFRHKAATLVICAATGVGCGGSGDGGGTTGPEPAVLTTVEVTPASAEPFSASPGNTVKLTVVAKDQHGGLMNNIGSISFSSQNGIVAAVGSDGTVTAVAAGAAQVTASMTAGGITKSGVTTVTVRVAAPTATVTAPGFTFEPVTVDISAGGEVTWTMGAIQHNVTFNTPGAPAEIPALSVGSASRTFPGKGIFTYNCVLHAGMTGSVQVH